MASMCGQSRRTLHPALGHVGLQCGTLLAALVPQSFWLNELDDKYKKFFFPSLNMDKEL